MYKRRIEWPGIEVGQLVLAAGAQEAVPCAMAQTAIVPFKPGLIVGSQPLDQFGVHLVGANGATVSNPTGTVILAAVLSIGSGDALWMFGSRAHGTQRAQSDLDVMVVYDGPSQGYKSGALVIHFENRDALMQRARTGELFVRYLTQGARPVVDPGGDFDALCAQYRAADSYDDTVAATLQLMHLLCLPAVLDRHADYALGKLLWALRTVLMAQGHDPFTKLNQLPAPDRTILTAVHDAKYTKDRAQALHHVRGFLDRLGSTPNLSQHASIDDWAKSFAQARQPFIASIVEELRKLEAHKRKAASFRVPDTSPDAALEFWGPTGG